MSLSERDLTSPLGIQQYLQDRGWTGPLCDVERLAGGFSGFVFRARISNENDDGPSTIIVKHVAGYAARWPEFKIGQDRMVCYLLSGMQSLWCKKFGIKPHGILIGV